MTRTRVGPKLPEIRGTGRLRRPEDSFRVLYTTCIGVWLTGILWLVFHFWFRRQTDFGVAAHPLEHWWLVAHGAFAFASLWMLGTLWRAHITRGWRARRHRKTGGTLFAAFMALVVSGYLLYYVGEDRWRDVLSPIHWIVGAALPLSFIGHWLLRRR